VPPDIAEKAFGLSVSVIDPRKQKPLYYNPEYVIYRRIDPILE